MTSNTGGNKHARASIYFRISSLLGLCPRQRSYLSSDFSQIWYTGSFCQDQEQFRSVAQPEVIYVHVRQFTSALPPF